MFHAYLPDLLTTRAVVLEEAVTTRAADVEATVRELTAGPVMRVLEG